MSCKISHYISQYSFCIGLLSLLLVSCSKAVSIQEPASPQHLIPYPRKMDCTQNQVFKVNSKTLILARSKEEKRVADHLQSFFPAYAFEELNVSAGEHQDNTILISIDAQRDLDPEAYQLNIGEQGVVLQAATEAGAFYGVMTLLQLSKHLKGDTYITFASISDAPAHSWRGMHLDVSRHFFPLEYIKKTLKRMALHKLNTFHWHLVDGIGWRIDIKKYPQLTEWGAWRQVKEGKKPWEDFQIWKRGDTLPKYGGFYTQEEIKELVAYANSLHITVVPEIELPGHSQVVMQCYPTLSCVHNGEIITNSDVYCAANPDSYQLLEGVLDEVLKLFPSEYIHIGGDEVSKENWKKCDRCKKLAQQKGYKPQEIQSHFIKHFNDYLKSKGRKMIGWHEILEGDLDRKASVMYWGSDQGISECLDKGFPTVLAVGNRYYLDHYQAMSLHEPEAIGGYSPLAEVYAFDPVPDSLSPAQEEAVMGLQACVWTEYLYTQALVDRAVFPRLAALAETAWTPKEKKSWKRFRLAIPQLMNLYKKLDILYAPSAFRPMLEAHLDRSTGHIHVSLRSELPCSLIYSVDSLATWTPYVNPIVLDTSTRIFAKSLIDGKQITEMEDEHFIVNEALKAKVSFINPPYPKYSAQGEATLNDAVYAKDKWGSGKCLAWLNAKMVVELDFPQAIFCSQVGVNALQAQQSGIYFPTDIKVDVLDENNQVIHTSKTSIAYTEEEKKNSEVKAQLFTVKLEHEPKHKLKKIRISVDAEYPPSKGGIFLFVDEVIVH